MEWTGGGAREVRWAPALQSFAAFFSRSLGFALLIALAARISWPVPGTPVPATLQVLALLLAGGALGARGAVVSVGLYLAAGMAGVPVFAAGGGPFSLLGPTGGYLAGFLPAAWIAGRFSDRSSRLAVLVPGFLLAVAVVHLCGWTQLSALTGGGAAVVMGTAPFLAFDVLKALVAAALVRVWRGRLRGRGTLSGEELG